MEKRKINKIESYVLYAAIVLYLLCRYIDLPSVIEYFAMVVWGQCMVYQLVNWKENKKSDNYYNLFVLVVLLAVLFSHIFKL